MIDLGISLFHLNAKSVHANVNFLLCFLRFLLCICILSYTRFLLPLLPPSPSLPPSLPLTHSLGCCPQHLRGAVTNCPRKSSHGPRAPPFIFSDSNLLLALLHTCHCVFFLTLEAGGKRSVINGLLRQPATALSSWCDNCAPCLSQ